LQAIYQTQTGEIAGVDASTEVPKNYTPSTVKHPLDKAVFLPRVYPFQDSLWIEDHATVKAVNADLNPAEYPVKYIEEIARFGRVHAIAKDPESASWVGAADPDWEGTTEYFSSEKKD